MTEWFEHRFHEWLVGVLRYEMGCECAMYVEPVDGGIEVRHFGERTRFDAGDVEPLVQWAREQHADLKAAGVL